MDVVSVLLIAVLAILFLAATLDSYDLLDPFRAKVVSDPLAFLGVGSAVIAFLLWAWPETCYDFGAWYCSDWFLLSRISIFAPLFVLSFILLLLRRR